MFYLHAARQAAVATEHIRRSAGSDPAGAADPAWAAAATFHATARTLRDPALRNAADTYDRAARAANGENPAPYPRREPAARLLAMAGRDTDGAMPAAAALAARLVSLAAAVAELRQAQQHAAQAAAARQAAERLYASLSQTKAGAAALGRPVRPDQTRTAARRPGDLARLDFPVPLQPGQPLPADPRLTGSRASYSPARSAPSRAGPRR